MHAFNLKKRALAIAVACSSTLVGGFYVPVTFASGFIDDSTLTGGIYYWQRQRDRKEMDPVHNKYGQYTENLHHSTFNGSLDFSSGYAADFIGLELGVHGALQLAGTGPAAPNEIAFSNARSRWGEKFDGDANGASFYKAAVKLKHDNYWLRGGYIQPQGQTLLMPQWGFVPGTYRGFEVGSVYDFDDAGALSLSYMWTDEYKAPWYREMYSFRKPDLTTKIKYLHSIGVKYDFKNKLVLEGAFGQAENYMDQYFTEASWAFPVAGNDLHTSWQFYGARNKEGGGFDNINNVYDGLAWLQAITLGYKTGPFDFRVEGTMVKARGNQGFFLARMTPVGATSNGRNDVWWDSRSDFNANGEKSLFAGVLYDLQGWQLPGWAVGTSYAYGWDARPSSNPVYDQSQRRSESAWNMDLRYTVQQGRAKDTQINLHYTRYRNHSDIPSFSNGYGNMFQDEKDVRLTVVAPFTIF